MLTDMEKDQLLTDAEIVMPFWIGDMDDRFNRKTEMAIHKLAYMETYSDIRDFDVCCPETKKHKNWKISRQPWMAIVLATIGKEDKEIAIEMKLLPETIKEYIKLSREKLSCTNRTNLSFKINRMMSCRIDSIRMSILTRIRL